MIPYILAAVGGYLLGQSRKETYADGGVVSNMSNKEKGKVFSFLDDYNLSDEVYNWWERFGYTKDEAKDIENSWAISRGYKMSDGGMMADGGKAGFITIAEMMREYFKLKRLKDNDYAFMDSDFDDFESGDYESLLGDVKDGVLKITNKGNTLLLDQNDDYHITFNGKKLGTNDLFKEGDKYFFAKNNEYLTFKKNGRGMMWLDKDGKVSIATKGMDASYFVFMFDNKKDWENYQPSMMAKGGKVKSKKWIQDALSGGKNKGALRRTAAKKGLLRGDENLSKTDLNKLQKMGGTTAKRAHLAETLRKFDEGGGVNNPDFMTTQDLKSVNADFFESNLNFDNAMKKYAALPYGGLYVYNGKDWQIIPRTSEISHERDAKKFLFAQLKNEEKFSRALDELEKSHP